MLRIGFVLLIAFVLLQSCKSEIPQKSEKNITEVKRTEHYCFMESVKTNKGITTLTLDIIEYKRISDLDSTIKSSQIIELPNGFCYINEKVSFENYELANDSRIIMQTISNKEDGSFNFNEAINLNKFIDIANGSKFKMLKLSPFKVVIERQKIVLLEEIYLP
jgi:hypothetical protein